MLTNRMRDLQKEKSISLSIIVHNIINNNIYGLRAMSQELWSKRLMCQSISDLANPEVISYVHNPEGSWQL